MRDRIKLSKISTDRLDSVKRNLRLSGEDYIPMRIAWGRSMQSAVEPEVPVIKGEKAKASSAKEVQLSTFEQQEGLLFKALTSQRYQRKIEGSEYIKILTQHIEHGLWLIAKDNERLKGYDYIMMITNATNLHKEQKQIRSG